MKIGKADDLLSLVWVDLFFLKVSLVFALLMPIASFLNQLASKTSLADASYD